MLPECFAARTAWSRVVGWGGCETQPLIGACIVRSYH